MLAIEKIEQVTRENLPALTVLTGDDIGQYNLLKQQLLKQIAYEVSDLTASYFDLREVVYQEVALDLESLPFFSEDKLVILDQLSDLTTAKKRLLLDDELKQLEAYLEAPIQTTKLLLLIPGKLDAKRRIVKLLKRDAQIFEAVEAKELEIYRYFSQKTQIMGLNLTKPVLEELLLMSHFNFSHIQENLNFLAIYKGKSYITSADIQEAIPKTLQDNIFHLTQLILKHKLDEARSLVKDLTLQGEDEIKLIAVMLNQFRLFTQVRLLTSLGKREAEVVSELSDILGRRVNPYQIRFAIRDSKAISLEQLKRALSLLIQTDYQIKSGLHDKSYLFDVALIKLAN